MEGAGYRGGRWSFPGQLETQAHSQTLLHAIALVCAVEKSSEVTTRELVLV